MKTKTFLFIVLSSLLAVACSKDSETPPSFNKITEEQLKSYFPYAKGDQMEFEPENAPWNFITYTVKEFAFANKEGKMTVTVSMAGREPASKTDDFSIELNAEVTDNKILKIDFAERIITIPSSLVTGTYTYDAGKEDGLPEEITLSNGAIVKKDKGLVYYEDYDSNKIYFLKRK